VQLTPAGLEQQLKDALAEEIRALARSLLHTDVYAIRRMGQKQAMKALQAMSKGVPESSSLDRHPGSGGGGAADLEAAEVRAATSEEAKDIEIADVTATMEARLNKQFMPQVSRVWRQSSRW
jgi:phenylpyruvate tautomerase PptA (4-oxalocrotonate tautomerase family)